MSLKTRSTRSLSPWIGAGVLILMCLISRFSDSRNTTESSNSKGGDLIERFETITYDARVRLATKFLNTNQISTNLATLFIDDIAVQRINRGTYAYALAPAPAFPTNYGILRYVPPWPRFIYGQLIRELSAQGATAVGFDILMPDADPSRDNTDVPLPIGGAISSDDFFADALRNSSNAVLATQGELMPNELFLTNSLGLGNIFSQSDNGVLRKVQAFSYRNIWQPTILELRKAVEFELESAVIHSNKITFFKLPDSNDRDGQPIDIPLNANGTLNLKKDGSINVEEDAAEQGPANTRPFTQERVWNLGIVLASLQLGIDLKVAVIKDHEIILQKKSGELLVIPTELDHSLYIDWNLRFEDLSKHLTPVYYGNMFPLLVQDFGRQRGSNDVEAPFTNKVVVIGSVVTGNNLTDMGSTPLSSTTPLVTKHLNIANSLLMNRFVRRASTNVETILLLAFGIISIWVTWHWRVLTATLSMAVLFILYVFIACWVYIEYRYWLPLVTPLLGGAAAPHFALLTYRVIFEQREQRRVKAVFSRIVSPDIVHELLGGELALGGKRRRITIFFADVRGFTQFTDASQVAAENYILTHKLIAKNAEDYFDLQAKETLATVNMYLSTIADQVKAHSGTLDKYIGDCVMAFWGAPVGNEKHAVACVNAALDAQRSMHALNADREKQNVGRTAENVLREKAGEAPLPLLPVLALGTGINTGMAVVGLMGSNEHILNYTVFGREVNLASRLEGVSGRGRVIISQTTFEDLQKFSPSLTALCTELESVSVKGISQPVRIYEVRWRENESETSPA